MGFVDFLVPFAQNLGIPLFEAIVFALSAVSALVAWYATRQFIVKAEGETDKPKVNA
jgi:hypothetical protein